MIKYNVKRFAEPGIWLKGALYSTFKAIFYSHTPLCHCMVESRESLYFTFINMTPERNKMCSAFQSAHSKLMRMRRRMYNDQRRRGLTSQREEAGEPST